VSKITEIYNQLDKTLSSDKNLLNSLVTELGRIVSSAYTQAMNSDEGYCFKFMLPISSVLKLYALLKLDQKKVGEAFQSDWKFPSNATMYNDSYYHILLLLVYYGLKQKNRLLVEHALFIILMKLWNGRKAKFIKFCDKRVMNYVVTHMVNNKHLVTKYDSPMILLKEYFVPTLLAKYQDNIIRDPYWLRQLFMQAWGRIEQMFRSNTRINMETGAKEALGGLLPLYMKAKQENLYISSPKIMASDEEEPEFDQYSTIHNRDQIISTTTDYITMNVNPQYSTTFISTVNDNTKVSSKVIEKILIAMHNHKYYDLIHDIISIMLSRTNVVDKNDICRPEFLNNVKKNIISSKNTSEVRNIQKLLDLLVSQIFKEKLNINFSNYSNVQQIQIRNVVIYGLIYNLRKRNCQEQTKE
jgi:hypothetical protein